MAATQTDLAADEHRTLREGAGLLDRSERGKLALSGPGAIEFLNGQVTNELAELAPGEGRYAAFLTPKGKMLGDLRVLAVAGDGVEAAALGPAGAAAVGGSSIELLLDTERVALQALFDMIRRFKIGYSVELHKRTLERGLLSLIGPESARVAGAESLPADEHANAVVEIDGLSTLAIRTDLGIDLLCDAADDERLREALLARGALAVSEQAGECVRVESGRPRYGLDIDETTIPQEAGLNARAVSFTKGCYVGQETVARLHWKGKPNRYLRGLRLSELVANGAELRLGERVVGRLGSTAMSPELGAIGLALVRREAEPGTTVAVGEQGTTGLISELPFAPPT